MVTTSKTKIKDQATNGNKNFNNYNYNWHVLKGNNQPIFPNSCPDHPTAWEDNLHPIKCMMCNIFTDEIWQLNVNFL